MKHTSTLQTIYWLAYLVGFVSLQTQAQDAPFVGANTIVLSHFFADKPAHNVVATVLAEQQLSATVERNRLIIRLTDNSPVIAEGIVFEGELTINSGIITLTGYAREKAVSSGSTALSAQTTPVLFAKGRSSRQRLAFLYMDALARKLQTALRASLTYKYQAPVI